MRQYTLTLAVVMCVLLVCAGPAHARYGRTEGGYAGGMLGAVGGAAVGNALIAGAGIANPLLATGVVATTALGAGLGGARAGSWIGDRFDKRFTPKQIWTVVGAVTGGMLGVVLGPAGSVLGKVIGGGVGAAVGGFVARHFASKADRDFNPRTVGALMGAINGAMIGGPVGAAAGVAAGYVGGHLLDKYVLVEPSKRDGKWRDGDSGVGTDTDGDGVPDWYPDWYTDKYYNDGDYVGGYDREGYDRMGYDRDGYDREGYDRFGYDDEGVDRQGYDKRGFKVREPDEGDDDDDDADTTVGKADEYDPAIYNQYWRTYNWLGCPYPEFDDKHWDHFHQSRRDELRMRHQAGHRRCMQITIKSNLSDEELADLRDEYREAVRQFREACKDAKATLDEKRVLMGRVSQLEKEMSQKIRGMK